MKPQPLMLVYLDNGSGLSCQNVDLYGYNFRAFNTDTRVSNGWVVEATSIGKESVLVCEGVSEAYAKYFVKSLGDRLQSISAQVCGFVLKPVDVFVAPETLDP